MFSHPSPPPPNEQTNLGSLNWQAYIITNFSLIPPTPSPFDSGSAPGVPIKFDFRWLIYCLQMRVVCLDPYSESFLYKYLTLTDGVP